MSNVTDYDVEEQVLDDTLRLWQTLFMIFVKWTWIPPAVFGVPGNIICIIVATRKHNRSLSPCVYMTCMAVVDSVVLLCPCLLHPLVFHGLGKDIVDGKEFMFQ